MLDGEIAERHRGGEVEAGLIAGAHLGARRRNAAGIEACDRPLPLMHDLPMAVGKQARGIADARMQLDAVEGRLLDRSEPGRLARALLPARQAPFAFTAMKVVVGAGPRKAIEALHRVHERFGIDRKLCRQRSDGIGARHCLRHRAAGRTIGE